MPKQKDITLLETIIADVADITLKKFITKEDLEKLGYKYGDKSIVLQAVQKRKPLTYTVIELKDKDEPKWVPSFCLLMVSRYRHPFTLNYPYQKYEKLYNS